MNENSENFCNSTNLKNDLLNSVDISHNDKNKKRKMQYTSTQINSSSQFSFAPNNFQTSTQVAPNLASNLVSNVNNTSLIVLVSDDETETIPAATKKKSPKKKLNLYEAQLKKIEKYEQQAKTSVPIEAEKKISLMAKFVSKLNVSTNSDDDFDPRAKLKTPVKRLQRPAKKPITKRPRKQPDIRKMVRKKPSVDQMVHQAIVQQCKDDNFDPDQVQLALAISKSNALLTRDQTNETSSQNERFKSLSEKYGKVKRTLEGFGFKSKSSYTDIDLETLFGPARSRKPSFKPTLLTKRSKERQDALLAERVQILLNEEYKENVAVPIQEQKEYQFFSIYLEPYLSTEPSLFYMNSNSEPLADCINKYYSTGLFPVSTVKADYLLQDWSKIPGRSRSPSPQKRPFDASLQRTSTSPLKELNVTVAPKDSNVTDYGSGAVSEDLFTETSSTRIEIQSKLNELQSNLASQKALAKSCEDLFADSDESMMYFETNDSDDVKTGHESGKISPIIIRESELEVKLIQNSPLIASIEESLRKGDDCIVISSSSSTHSISQQPVHELSQHESTITNQIDITKLIKRCDELLEGFASTQSGTEPMETEIEQRPISPMEESPLQEAANDILPNSTAVEDQTLPPELKDESIYTRIQRLENFLKNGKYSDSDSDSDSSHISVEIINPPTTDSPIPNPTDDFDSDNSNEKTVIYFSPEKNCSFNNDDDLMAEIVSKSILINEGNISNEATPVKISPKKNALAVDDDDFDEFDQMVYGMEKKVEEIESNSVEQPRKSSLAKDFSRVYSEFKEDLPKRPFEVRTRDVTPPPDYENMDDIKLEWEMKKYGLKYIKKKEDRVKFLNYIYSRTHPFIEVVEDDKNISLCLVSTPATYHTLEDKEICPTPKLNQTDTRTPKKRTPRKFSPKKPTPVKKFPSARLTRSQPVTEKVSVINEPIDKYQLLELKYGLAPSQPRVKKSTKKSPVKNTQKSGETIVSSALSSQLSSQETNKVKSSPAPSIKLEDFFNPDSSSELYLTSDAITNNLLSVPSDELIFLPVKQKGKLQWCPQPLHIAFVNMLRVNNFLKIKILRYEPFEIEVIYKYFKQIGARYELSDLKTFFDRKCITFRSEN